MINWIVITQFHRCSPQLPTIHILGRHNDPNPRAEKNCANFVYQKSIPRRASLTSSLSFCANGSRCSCSMYFSRLKNVSKNIAVILHRFRSVSVMQSRFTGLIMSSICEGEINQLRQPLHRERRDLLDTGSLRMATSRFPAAPCDAAAPHKNIPARTSRESRRRRCPCSGTSTRSPSRDFCPLPLAGTTRSRCTTCATRSDHSGRSAGLGRASHIRKRFVQSFATRELQVDPEMSSEFQQISTHHDRCDAPDPADRCTGHDRDPTPRTCSRWRRSARSWSTPWSGWCPPPPPAAVSPPLNSIS